MKSNVFNILKYVFYFFVILFVIILGIFYFNVPQDQKTAAYNKITNTEDPKEYIKLKPKIHNPLVGKDYITLTIENYANNTKFKNLNVSLEFYDENKNRLETESFSLNINIMPNQRLTQDIYHQTRGFRSVSAFLNYAESF